MKAFHFVTVNYSFERCIDVERHAAEINGDISVFTDDIEGQENCGEIRATQYNLDEAILYNVCPFDAFDMVSGQPLDLFCEITDINHYPLGLKREWKEFFKQRRILDIQRVLYIESVRVEDRFAGNDIGLQALLNMISTFGRGVDMIILKVFPTHPENPTRGGSSRYDISGLSFQEATKKLAVHYNKIFFDVIPDTEYMVFDMRRVKISASLHKSIDEDGDFQ